MNTLITGISSGIGFELCKQAIEKGHNVIGLSRSDKAFHDLQSYATQSRGEFHGEVCNLERLNKDWHSGLADSLLRFGTIDMHINNAGLLIKGAFNDFDMNEFEQMLSANLHYPMLLCQSLKNKDGFSSPAHVINISSMGGYQGSSKYPGLMGYSVSKGALATFSECLAEEWKDDSISVNCLCLGAVQTEMLQNAFPGYDAPVTSYRMAEWILSFAITAIGVINGKVFPIAQNNP